MREKLRVSPNLAISSGVVRPVTESKAHVQAASRWHETQNLPEELCINQLNDSGMAAYGANIGEGFGSLQ